MSKRIYPAIGIMLFLGNFYMSWMASRMKEQYGRDFTAQPYGINTVGAFPFLFGIMMPTAFGAPVNGTDVGTPLEMAWSRSRPHSRPSYQRRLRRTSPSSAAPPSDR